MAQIVHSRGGGYNTEEWVTTSGTWTAPIDGYYEVLLIDGGNAGTANLSTGVAQSGTSGCYDIRLVKLNKDEEVNITIGTGGTASATSGGKTYFKGLGTRFDNKFSYDVKHGTNMLSQVGGSGFGGSTNMSSTVKSNGTFYGAGGGAVTNTTSGVNKALAGDGYQGAVRIRYYNPDIE